MCVRFAYELNLLKLIKELRFGNWAIFRASVRRYSDFTIIRENKHNSSFKGHIRYAKIYNMPQIHASSRVKIIRLSKQKGA